MRAQIKKHGDTIIEVMMAVAIFAIIAVVTIGLMNNGVSNIQRTLEYTMARNEIDSQAEALRYIHHSYVAERQLDKDDSQFRLLWDTLRDIAISERDLTDHDNDDSEVKFDINNISKCSDAYAANGMVRRYNAFTLNTRMILPQSDYQYGEYATYEDAIKDIVVGIDDKIDNAANDEYKLRATTLYPRIIYKEGAIKNQRTISGVSGSTTENSSLAETRIYNSIERAEGIFMIVVGDNADNPKRSNYYDFYIRTCWHSVGSRAPSTITTIVRLYNPEVIE